MLSYILFHPDNQRQLIEVKADIFRKGAVEKNWQGQVLLDNIIEGNEDPWCRSQPWMYSYCHATQLKRSVMEAGDIVFFVSGDAADKDKKLQCDTVFIIKEKFEWVDQKIPEKLLKKYPKNIKDNGWERHLSFGLPEANGHKGKCTFTAQNFSKNLQFFSYLPIDESGKNVSIPLDELKSTVSLKVREKLKGRYPVKLTAKEVKILYKTISRRAAVKVVKIQKVTSKPAGTISDSCGGCSSGKSKKGFCC